MIWKKGEKMVWNIPASKVRFENLILKFDIFCIIFFDICYMDYSMNWFLGCLVARILRCLATATWVYISVMVIELWPSISCIYRISTSASKRLVANVCRNICGVICISIDASSVYLFIMRRTAWSDKGVAAWLTKKESQASISFWKVILYFFKIQSTDSFPIWMRRSFDPFP